jgi:hypothetical protein
MISGTETSLRVWTSSYDVKGQKKRGIYSSTLLTFRNSTVIIEVSEDSPFVRQSRVAVKTNIGGRIHMKKTKISDKSLLQCQPLRQPKIQHGLTQVGTRADRLRALRHGKAIASLNPYTKHLEVGPRSKRLNTALLVFR